jgi:hypothetical protein
MSMNANGYHDIEFIIDKGLDVFRSLTGDIDRDLGHRLYCKRIKPVGFDPCRISIDTVPLEVACPTLGHLATARIAGTEEKKFDAIIHSRTMN